MVDNTFVQLNKISKLHFYDSQYNDDNKTAFHSKNETNSKREYHIKKPYDNRKNESWRKQKVDDLSENVSNNSRQHQFASKHIKQNKPLEKYSDLNIEPSTSEHKVIYNNLPVKKSIEPMNSLNNSDSFETKLKKFENKFGSLGNLHVVSIEKNSINKPFSSRTHGRGTNRYDGYKSSWRNQQDDSQHSQGNKNKYPKNQQDGNPRHKFGNRPLSSGSYKKDIDETES